MVEILGNNLDRYFKYKNPGEVSCGYKGDRYEVWMINDSLFDFMKNQPDKEFETEAGLDAWWRYTEGSNITDNLSSTIVNGFPMVCWKKENEELGQSYCNLSKYLCDYIGASNGKNVCACSVDLAKYNHIKLWELFVKYEG